MTGSVISYCGLPPTAATLAERWNLDPVLIGALLAVALGYVWWARRSALSLPRWRLASASLGWGVTALALISPLCALAVSLFAARVGQHMLLTLIAAPLVALGLPCLRLRPNQIGVAAVLYTVALWVWHAPGPYTATFQSDVTYWAMHVTTYGAALWFWWNLASAPAARLAGSAAATVVVGLQMALLGAVITWAGAPLYPPHLLTTGAWGLTPLEDQQLGGALMWVPAGLIFMAAIVVPMALALRGRPALAAA